MPATLIGGLGEPSGNHGMVRANQMAITANSDLVSRRESRSRSQPGVFVRFCACHQVHAMSQRDRGRVTVIKMKLSP